MKNNTDGIDINKITGLLTHSLIASWLNAFLQCRDHYKQEYDAQMMRLKMEDRLTGNVQADSTLAKQETAKSINSEISKQQANTVASYTVAYGANAIQSAQGKALDNLQRVKAWVHTNGQLFNQSKIFPEYPGRSYKYSRDYRLDVLAQIDKNHVAIIDWKTGKAKQDDLTQLVIYACYLCEHFAIYSADIICVYINGPSGYGDLAEKRIRISRKDINAWANNHGDVLAVGKPSDPHERCYNKPSQSRTINDSRCQKCKYKANCPALLKSIAVRLNNIAASTNEGITAEQNASLSYLLNVYMTTDGLQAASKDRMIDDIQSGQISAPEYIELKANSRQGKGIRFRSGKFDEIMHILQINSADAGNIRPESFAHVRDSGKLTPGIMQQFEEAGCIDRPKGKTTAKIMPVDKDMRF